MHDILHYGSKLIIHFCFFISIFLILMRIAGIQMGWEKKSVDYVFRLFFAFCIAMTSIQLAIFILRHML